MSDEQPIEDRILIDLFRFHQEHGSTAAKTLNEWHQHSQAIAQLVEKRDIRPVGNDQFRITGHGQRRITAKYPDLRESPYPPWLRYERKPRDPKAGTRQRWGHRRDK